MSNVNAKYSPYFSLSLSSVNKESGKYILTLDTSANTKSLPLSDVEIHPWCKSMKFPKPLQQQKNNSNQRLVGLVLLFGTIGRKHLHRKNADQQTKRFLKIYKC